MNATPLSSGPVMGVLSASGSSPVFSSVPSQVAHVQVNLSPLAAAGLAASPATVSVKLMRSTDGGQTWSQVIGQVPQAPWQALNVYFVFWVNEQTANLYRLDCALSQGSMFFMAYDQPLLPAQPYAGGNYPAPSPYYGITDPFMLPVIVDEPGGSRGRNGSWPLFDGSVFTTITTAQLQTLCQAKVTPLTAAQIAAPLTLYKQCAAVGNSTNPWVGGVLAKLSVPAGVSTGFDYACARNRGVNRAVRASSVQIVSLTDLSGNPVSSAASIVDSSTIYTPGSTVTARDLYASNSTLKSTGTFDAQTYTAGIYGFTTLLEAACATMAPANLAALGL